MIKYVDGAVKIEDTYECYVESVDDLANLPDTVTEGSTSFVCTSSSVDIYMKMHDGTWVKFNN